MTRVISNSTADAAGDCYLAAYDVFFFYYLKSTGFKDPMDYLSAFLQNLIGNIISFNSIYQAINVANSANKTADVYFNLGRLAFLIFDVKPIDLGSLK